MQHPVKQADGMRFSQRNSGEPVWQKRRKITPLAYQRKRWPHTKQHEGKSHINASVQTLSQITYCDGTSLFHTHSLNVENRHALCLRVWSMLWLLLKSLEDFQVLLICSPWEHPLACDMQSCDMLRLVADNKPTVHRPTRSEKEW